MSLFALPFGTEHLEHVVFVVDETIEDPERVVAAVRTLDPAKSRGTMLSVGGKPKDALIANALGLEWEYMNRGIGTKSIVGRTILAGRFLRDLEADRVVVLSQKYKTAFEIASKMRGLPRKPRNGSPEHAVPVVKVDPKTADPKHIAIILKTNLNRPTAHVMQTLNTAVSLIRRGWTLTLCAPLKSKYVADVLAKIQAPAEEKNKINFLPMESAKRSVRSVDSMHRLMNELVRRGASIVYYRQLRISTWLVPAARERGLRVFVEVHNPYTTWAGAARRRLFDEERKFGFAAERKFARSDRELERGVFERVDGVLCTTDAMLRYATRLAPKTPALVLRNGAPDPADFGEPLPWNDREVDLIYTGKTAQEKGTDILVEAMQYLPDVRLLVVGGPANRDLRPYRRQADALGVRNRCKFLTWELQHQLFQRVRKARVAVHPLSGAGSREWRIFTCPLKVLEYMAIGTPFIATDLPAIRELVTPDVNGILVPPGDAKALADGIRRLLSNPEFAMQMARNAQEAVRGFAHDARAEQLEAFLTPHASARPHLVAKETARAAESR